MRRGEVWQVSLAPRSGSEQRGVRPAVVLSSDVMNSTPGWRSFVVVPLSSSERQAARGPVTVALPAGTAGLSLDSVALCHQLTTLDRSTFLERLGQLESAALRAIELGVLTALDIDPDAFTGDLT